MIQTPWRLNCETSGFSIRLCRLLGLRHKMITLSWGTAASGVMGDLLWLLPLTRFAADVIHEPVLDFLDDIELGAELCLFARPSAATREAMVGDMKRGEGLRLSVISISLKASDVLGDHLEFKLLKVSVLNVTSKRLPILILFVDCLWIVVLM